MKDKFGNEINPANLHTDPRYQQQRPAGSPKGKDKALRQENLLGKTTVIDKKEKAGLTENTD